MRRRRPPTTIRSSSHCLRSRDPLRTSSHRPLSTPLSLCTSLHTSLHVTRLSPLECPRHGSGSLSAHLPSQRPSTRAIQTARRPHGPSYFSSPFLHYPALRTRPALHTSLHTSRPAPLRRYVMGWDSGTWVDSQGNAASALSFKQVRRRSALESSPASPPASPCMRISMCISRDLQGRYLPS